MAGNAVADEPAYTTSAFLSYDPHDIADVQHFLHRHHDALVGVRTVGVTSSDDLVRWHERSRIVDAIQRRYIGDAAITIVLVGDRTWTRRFIDWEVAASAASGCAVLAVPLTFGGAAPARVRLLAEEGSAIILREQPSTPRELGGWIATALDARRTNPRQNGTERALQLPLMPRDTVMRVRRSS